MGAKGIELPLQEEVADDMPPLPVNPYNQMTGTHGIGLSALSVQGLSAGVQRTHRYSLQSSAVSSDIVCLVVLWRLRYKLSLHDLAEMFLVRGFVFTHETGGSVKPRARW